MFKKKLLALPAIEAQFQGHPEHCLVVTVFQLCCPLCPDVMCIFMIFYLIFKRNLM
jgi:hypothetical protein